MLRINPFNNTPIYNKQNKTNKYSFSFTSRYQDADHYAHLLAVKAKLFFNEGNKGIERKTLANGVYIKTKFEDGFQTAVDRWANIYKLRYDKFGKLYQITEKKADGTKRFAFLKGTAPDFFTEKFIETSPSNLRTEYKYNQNNKLEKVTRNYDNGSFDEEFYDVNEKLRRSLNKIVNSQNLNTDNPKYTMYTFINGPKLGEFSGCYQENNGKDSIRLIETYYYPNENPFRITEIDNFGLKSVYEYRSDKTPLKSLFIEPNIGEIKIVNYLDGNMFKMKTSGINGDEYSIYLDKIGNIIRTEDTLKDEIEATYYYENEKIRSAVKKYLKQGITKTQEVSDGKIKQTLLENSKGEKLIKEINNGKISSMTYRDPYGYEMKAEYQNEEENSFLDKNGKEPPINLKTFYNLCNNLIPEETNDRRLYPFIENIRIFLYYESN